MLFVETMDFLVLKVAFFLTLYFYTAPRADAIVSRPTAIVIRNHIVAEAEVAIVIADGKSVEVLTETVHDDEAKNVGVTNEGVTTAGTETKGENQAEAEARTGEAETKTEKDAVEVAIETESGDEVLIVINLEVEVTETRRKTERRTGRVVDEGLYKTVKTMPVRCPSCVLQCHMICAELDFVKGVLLYLVYRLLKIVNRMLDYCKVFRDLLLLLILLCFSSSNKVLGKL